MSGTIKHATRKASNIAFQNWAKPQGLREACITKFVHTADRIGLLGCTTRASRGGSKQTMKTILLATAFILAPVGIASAADINEVLPVDAAYSWSGLYAGVHVGYEPETLIFSSPTPALPDPWIPTVLSVASTSASIKKWRTASCSVPRPTLRTMT
jgi:hypothetical protein